MIVYICVQNRIQMLSKENFDLLKSSQYCDNPSCSSYNKVVAGNIGINSRAKGQVYCIRHDSSFLCFCPLGNTNTIIRENSPSIRQRIYSLLSQTQFSSQAHDQTPYKARYGIDILSFNLYMLAK